MLNWAVIAAQGTHSINYSCMQSSFTFLSCYKLFYGNAILIVAYAHYVQSEKTVVAYELLLSVRTSFNNLTGIVSLLYDVNGKKRWEMLKELL